MEVLIFLRAFFAFLIAFLMTFYLVPLCSKLAYSLKILDIPDGKIKNHKRPTPYLGGLAVYIGFLISLAFTLPFENQISMVLLGCTLLLFIGLIDDLLAIKPYQKFFGQLIATFCFLKTGFFLKETFFLNNMWLNIPASCLWILAIINAFNLIDIMDGLATTVAFCATFSFMVVALLLHQYTLLLLLCAFLGALVAFFYYNKPLAEIYLGDTGSLFIGGFFATVPFLFKWGTYNWYGYLTPIVILAIPLLEVASLVCIRTYKGIPFYHGSPDHFALYLKRNGWTEWDILKYLGQLSSCLLITASILILNKINFWQFMIIGGLFLIMWFAVLCINIKAFHVKIANKRPF